MQSHSIAQRINHSFFRGYVPNENDYPVDSDSDSEPKPYNGGLSLDLDGIGPKESSSTRRITRCLGGLIALLVVGIIVLIALYVIARNVSRAVRFVH